VNEDEGEDQSLTKLHLPNAISSYEKPPPTSESKYKLDPHHVSYILIKCMNYGMERRLPSALPALNQWTAGIEQFSAPPFLSLGMFYQSSMESDGLLMKDLGVPNLRGHPGARAVAIINPHFVLGDPFIDARSPAKSLQKLLATPSLIFPNDLDGYTRCIKAAQQRYRCGSKGTSKSLDYPGPD
jgi:hypothetical protein